MPHQQNACIFLLTAIGLIAWLGSGCRPEDEPEYNHLRPQLLQDIFKAVQEEDSKTALNALDRLRSLTAETAFIETMAQRERNRILITRVNNMIEQGKLENALTELNNASGPNSQKAELEPMHQAIVELMQLRKFVVDSPYPDAARTEKALDQLLAKLSPEVRQGAPLAAWIPVQQQLIKDRYEDERQARIAELLRLYDQALGSNAAAAALPGIEQELRKIAAEHPLPRLQQELAASGQFPYAEAVPLTRQYLELAACRLYLDLDTPVRERIAQELKNRESASLAGVKLRVLSAAANGDAGTVKQYGRELLEAGGSLNYAEITTVAQTLVMPIPQFKARPWRRPFPTADDLLNRITQIREQSQ